MTHFTINNNELHHRRGSILLMVLVAIILMTLTTSTYMLLMRNEHRAARHSGNHLQTERFAQSGIEYLRVFLAQTTAEIEQQGGLINNPETFQEVLVLDDELASYRGRFTIVAPDMSQGYYQNLRYGLENESAKLNLNSLLSDEDSPSAKDDGPTPSDRLMLIPGMNEAVAEAILDWLDQDDSPRTQGAEADYYQSLTPAYLPRNGPLSQLDELLMIQGVTPELLYGVDVNRNYLVDADELPRGALEQLDNTNGQLNRGWSAYLTVHSLERNVTPLGEKKMDLNAEDLQTLHGELQTALGVAEANYIIVYRQYGAAGETASGNAVGPEGAEGEGVDLEEVVLDFEKAGETSIESLLDLVESRVSIEGEGGKPGQLVESPWKDDSSTYRQGFSDLLDLATVDSGERTAGRVNINQASLPVLLTIPGMTETLADQLLSRRELAVDMVGGDQRHPIWLIAEGLMTLEELKPMFPYLTTGGDVYSGQIVGFFEAGTALARVEVLLDRSGTQSGSGTPARLLVWRDLSKLGPGFSLSVLGTWVEQIE